MTYTIYSPSDSAKYDLVQDLKKMADQTAANLNDLAIDLSKKLTVGGPAQVSSIISSGPGTFNHHVEVTGDVPSSYVINHDANFGLWSNGNYFMRTATGAWNSNQHILVPNNITGPANAAINRATLDALVNDYTFKTGIVERDVIGGHATDEETVTHGFNAVPKLFLAQAFNDTGIQSIVTSIGYLTTTQATIKIRNLNSSQSEHYKIFWLAMKP